MTSSNVTVRVHLPHLVHNHPSGDPTPSRADIDLTREIERALAPLDIKVHDHLVVGASETVSMKAKGLI